MPGLTLSFDFLPSCPVISCVLLLFSCSFYQFSLREFTQKISGCGCILSEILAEVSPSSFSVHEHVRVWLVGWSMARDMKTLKTFLMLKIIFETNQLGNWYLVHISSFLPKGWHCLHPSSWHLWWKAIEPPLPKHRILWHHCASRAEGGSGFFRVPWPALMVTKHQTISNNLKQSQTISNNLKQSQTPSMVRRCAQELGVFPHGPFRWVLVGWPKTGRPGPNQALGGRDQRAPKGRDLWWSPRIHQEAASWWCFSVPVFFQAK